jgi:hypothetical protein
MRAEIATTARPSLCARRGFPCSFWTEFFPKEKNIFCAFGMQEVLLEAIVRKSHSDGGTSRAREVVGGRMSAARKPARAIFARVSNAMIDALL